MSPEIAVLIAFALFIGLLIYAGLPRKILDVLDARADKIRTDLDEARRLREEAQSLLASYESRRKEISGLAREIVEQAEEQARITTAEAEANLEAVIARRLKTAEDHISAAQTAAVHEVRNQAAAAAIAAAAEVIAKKMTKTRADEMIDAAIKDVGAKLH